MLAKSVVPEVGCCCVAPNGLANNLGRGCRSFSGDAEVLLADEATRYISAIQVGEVVEAADPSTGERRSEEVLAVFVHGDMTIDFATSAGHRFWNAIAQVWQESQDIDQGDLLLASDGGTVVAVGLDWRTAEYPRVYNLDVDSLDSYFVSVGDQFVLVHNDDELTRTPVTHPQDFESVRGS